MTKAEALAILEMHIVLGSVELERVLGLLRDEARRDREYAAHRKEGSLVHRSIMGRVADIEETLCALESDNVAAIIANFRLGMHVAIAIARAEVMSRRERLDFETAIWGSVMEDAYVA